jgi:hypothetical protein
MRLSEPRIGNNLGSKWLANDWDVLDVDRHFLAGAWIKDGQGHGTLLSFT